MTQPDHSELFVEKRGAIRGPESPPIVKNAIDQFCNKDQCRPRPGSSVTDCCTRVVWTSPAPGVSVVMTPPAALQPVPGDFEPEPELFERGDES